MHTLYIVLQPLHYVHKTRTRSQSAHFGTIYKIRKVISSKNEIKPTALTKHLDHKEISSILKKYRPNLNMPQSASIHFRERGVRMYSSQFETHARNGVPEEDRHLWDERSTPNGDPVSFIFCIVYRQKDNFAMYRVVAGNKSGTFTFTSDTAAPHQKYLTYMALEHLDKQAEETSIVALPNDGCRSYAPHSRHGANDKVSASVHIFYNKWAGSAAIVNHRGVPMEYRQTEQFYGFLLFDFLCVQMGKVGNMASVRKSFHNGPRGSSITSTVVPPNLHATSTPSPAVGPGRYSQKGTNVYRDVSFRDRYGSTGSSRSPYPRKHARAPLHSSTNVRLTPSRGNHINGNDRIVNGRGRSPKISDKFPSDSLTDYSKEQTSVPTSTVQKKEGLPPKLEREEPAPLKQALTSTSRESVPGSLGRPIGLPNIYNTCYLNSVLQALNSIPIFRDTILRCMLDRRGDFSSALGSCRTGILLLDLFQELQFRDSTSNGVVECTRKLVKAVGEDTGSMDFPAGEQHDAQEFLMHLRMEMESALRNADGVQRLQYCLYTSLDELRDRALRGIFRAPTGNEYLACRFMSNTFRGVFQKTTVCLFCGECHNRMEDWYDLSLAIESEKGSRYGVQSCLLDYFAQVLLNGDNQYQCDSCGQRSDATLLTSVKKFPKVLTLHMMLFRQDLLGNVLKIERSVAAPREIDLSAFSDSSGGGHVYRLNSVVSHIGESRSNGHYVTMARDPNSGKWFMFNDHLVSQLTEEDVDYHLDGQAECIMNPYLLFYSQCDNE